MLFLRKSRRRLRSLIPELLELSSDLGLLFRNYSDPLDRVVAMFNLISPWHDNLGEIRNSLKFDPESEIGETLKNLFQRFERSGRNMYGFNRTKPGQLVTDENVYLGEVAGLHTKTVRYWKEHKDDDRSGLWGEPSLNGLNGYDVVSLQAIDLVHFQSKPIIELVKELEQLA